MAGRLILPPVNPSLDANGEVAAGSTLTFWINGTTTLQAVYSDAGLGTPLDNPLECDAAGRFPQVWAEDGDAYSVKWTVPGETPIVYDDITTNAFQGGDPIPFPDDIATDYIDEVTTDHGVAIKGCANNSSANAGYIGEYQTALPSGSLALTSGATRNLNSISLGKGDWDVSAHMVFAPAAGTTPSILIGGISLVSATMPASSSSAINSNREDAILDGAAGAGRFHSVHPGPHRISLNATTTIYAVMNATFTTSTAEAYATITARRAR